MIRHVAGVAIMFAAQLAWTPAATAHPPAIVSSSAEKALADEIQAFRKTMMDAIAANDAVRLKSLYHERFTHTHTSGKTDNRDARIVSALTGEPLIETSTPQDLSVVIPNDWVAVVTATSPIKSMADGKTYAVKWIQVFTRSETSWTLVASQATRSHEIKP